MAETKKVGLAQIGLGAWSSAIADAVQRSSNAKLVTCYTRTAEKRDLFSKKYGCDQESSYEDVLKRKDVDGKCIYVYIYLYIYMYILIFYL